MDPLFAFASDLRASSAEVQRAVRALAAYRIELARAPEANEAREPLAPFRRIAGRTMLDALAAFSPVSFDVPLRDALRRWVVELTLARIAGPQEVAVAKAMAEPSAHYTLREARQVSYREAWRSVMASEAPAQARAWLDAAAERGPAVAAALRERAAVRLEAARRLDLAEPASLALPLPRARLSALAMQLLDATEDAAAHVLAESQARARTRGHGVGHAPDPTIAIRVAVARDAPEGWPARLSPAWLSDLFPASGPGAPPDLTRGLRLALPTLPDAVGASSFARALALFGHAVAVAGVAPSVPFALADDPQFVRAHQFAFVFGALPASDAFQRRVLGVTPHVARDQARVLARANLVHARILAARYLLSIEAEPAAPDAFEELTSRAFGAPLPAALAGAWPLPRTDEPARLVAGVTSFAVSRELVERFDIDWFRNPRGAAHLRAIASPPARDDAADVERASEDASAACRALAKALEDAIA